MNELLKADLTFDYFDKVFSKVLQEMYTRPEMVSQVSKEKIKTEAMTMTEDFKKNIIDFYFTNLGTENEDLMFDKFGVFINTLLAKLKSLQDDNIIYTSVSVMWTSILTQMEKESKLSNDFGLLMTVQHFLIEFFNGQSEFFKNIKK